MEGSTPAGALRTTLGLLVAGPMLAVLAVVAATPATELEPLGLAWIGDALAVLLATLAAGAALAWLVAGLRSGGVAEPLLAAASAAVAGSALARLSEAGMAIPLAAAAAALAGASILDRTSLGLNRQGARVALAIGIIALAEAAVLAELVPGVATAVPGGAPLVAGVGIVLAVLAALVGFGRPPSPVALALLVGLAAAASDRGDGLGAIIGLAGLIGAQGISLVLGTRPPRVAPAVREREPDRLPDLAGHLRDAILRFDGTLQLRDWNAPATTLLGLDEASRGARLEDVLEVRIGELAHSDQVRGSVVGVGGLRVDLTRDDGGVTAIVRDPGTSGETDQLARELRGTIEELLQARRTIDLQRREIERSAAVDQLTGVGSRTNIMERLRAEVAQARRYQHPVAVVLLDLDRFGAINREHGMDGGDAVLRETALRIRLRVREADELGRIGSDSFLVILPHTDETGAATFADAALRRLRLRPATVDGAEVPLAASAGVAIMRSGEELDVDGLLARAHQQLERAKAAGGDRIAVDRLQNFGRPEETREPHEPGRPTLEVVDDTDG